MLIYFLFVDHSAADTTLAGPLFIRSVPAERYSVVPPFSAERFSFSFLSVSVSVFWRDAVSVWIATVSVCVPDSGRHNSRSVQMLVCRPRRIVSGISLC